MTGSQLCINFASLIGGLTISDKPARTIEGITHCLIGCHSEERLSQSDRLRRNYDRERGIC